MKIKSKQLTAIAYHEAGHAVACHRLGFEIETVTIVPKGESGGSVTTKPLQLDEIEFGVPTGKDLGYGHDHVVMCLERKHNGALIREALDVITLALTAGT